MPRVKLAAKAYARRDFAELVPGRLKHLGITQEQIASRMCIQQSTFSKKLKTFNFSYDEIVMLIEALKLENEEIIYFMTGRRESR